MKKSVIAALALSLMLMAGAAGASIIGIFGDQDATTCTATMTTQYTTTTVYYVAMLDDIGSMSACEFGATGVALTGMALPTVAWNTTLVIGDIMSPDGVALAFSTPLEAPLAYLGSIAYFLLAPVEPDHAMSIVPSGAGVLVVVDADTAVEYPAEGWSCIVNCTVGGPFGNCQCEDTIATEDAGHRPSGGPAQKRRPSTWRRLRLASRVRRAKLRLLTGQTVPSSGLTPLLTSQGVAT
jgi:hypothetical protein